VKDRTPPAPVSRRDALRRLGLTFAAVPLTRLVSACASGGANAGVDTTSVEDTAEADTATADTASPDPEAADTAAVGWATGGTAAMSGDYADPFDGGAGTACALVCAMTLGPCYAQTAQRQDVTEGHDGLPMRLALRVVDESCAPVAGAEVDIWHTAPEGLYSGSDAIDFCTGGDATQRAHQWFRGVQTTDADGRVDFDSCFPGWYAGRTIHIHFTVRLGSDAYVTSQLFFPDDLADDIIGTQPLYDARGPRDTTNQNDSVISGDSVGDYTVDWERQSDGALLAWKTLVIRSSLGASLCTA